MTNQFFDRADAITFLTEHLNSSGLGDNAEVVAQTLIDEWRVDSSKVAGDSTHRAVFKPTRWVIRDADLQLLNSLASVLRDVISASVLASSGHASDAKMAALAFSAGRKLIKVALNMYQKGARLEEHEFFVLMLLRKDSGGATLEALQDAYEARYGENGDVKALLERLADYPTRSETMALVRHGENGCWISQGV